MLVHAFKCVGPIAEILDEWKKLVYRAADRQDHLLRLTLAHTIAWVEGRAAGIVSDNPEGLQGWKKSEKLSEDFNVHVMVPDLDHKDGAAAYSHLAACAPPPLQFLFASLNLPFKQIEYNGETFMPGAIYDEQEGWLLIVGREHLSESDIEAFNPFSCVSYMGLTEV
jgi:hypothetical protein